MQALGATRRPAACRVRDPDPARPLDAACDALRRQHHGRTRPRRRRHRARRVGDADRVLPLDPRPRSPRGCRRRPTWIDPTCIHGPFAEIDPRIKPFWLNRVREVLPITRIWRAKPAEVVEMVFFFSIATFCWVWLASPQGIPVQHRLVLMGCCCSRPWSWACLAVGCRTTPSGSPRPWSHAAADISRRYAKEAMVATSRRGPRPVAGRDRDGQRLQLQSHHAG